MAGCKCVLLLLTVYIVVATAYHHCADGGPCTTDPQILPLPELLEDFQFEIRDVYTNRQRGARVNIFTKFRYYSKSQAPYYTTETGTFDYQEMKEVILKYVPGDTMNVSRDSFWEILNRDLCIAIWKQFPIRGLSIRMEVQGMSSGGIPGHRASTVTLGDIEPWVSIVNTFPGCDGMSVDKNNEACRITPSWDQYTPDPPVMAKKAAAKAGKHDKPSGTLCGAM